MIVEEMNKPICREYCCRICYGVKFDYSSGKWFKSEKTLVNHCVHKHRGVLYSIFPEHKQEIQDYYNNLSRKYPKSKTGKSLIQ